MQTATVQGTAGDISLYDPDQNPTDTVSNISWSNNPLTYSFACSSWDSKVRVYEYKPGSVNFEKKAEFATEDPCLGTCWADDENRIFLGSINSSVSSVDLKTEQIVNIGWHDDIVKDVYWLPAIRSLCSLSHDGTIRFWDLRQQHAVAKFDLGGKVLCSDLLYPNLAVGLNNQKMAIINLPNIQKTFQDSFAHIDSPLGEKTQLTCMSFLSDGSGIGLGGHDGRVNISRFNYEHNANRVKLANIMTFKAQTVDIPNTNLKELFNVNAIGSTPKSKQFLLTAGSDGNIIFWDYAAKNKIKSNEHQTPVTKAKFSPDGSLLAYALGYDWSKGIQGDMKHTTSVHIHTLQDNELYYISH